MLMCECFSIQEQVPCVWVFVMFNRKELAMHCQRHKDKGMRVYSVCRVGMKEHPTRNARHSAEN